MKVTKYTLSIFSFGFSLLLVYGSAFLINVVSGQYLFGENLTDSTYRLLALVIAFPIMFYATSSKQPVYQVAKVVLFTLLFVSILYLPAYISSALDNTSLMEMKEYVITNFVVVIVSLCVSHLSLHKRNK